MERKFAKIPNGYEKEFDANGGKGKDGKGREGKPNG